LFELSRQKISKRSLRTLEKPAFGADVTTETSRTAGSDPADLFLPARSESLYARIFLPRKFFWPKFFSAKVGNRKKIWLENFPAGFFPV